ncbi:hypothetical protein HRH59_05990 [Rheinheimera sp. YQF-2]|uniref:Uncharacterized protein n=2 Tax=Rheinheimera lutimaris TaxID=2740584 RepID=A0A7Y5EH64_9GAMM|nr:hypothetical protein [Rheinheimera lutimaris]
MNVAALLVTYNKIMSFKGEKAKELHGRFALVKKLACDLEENYSEILIILSGITRADLTIDEIRWFINEPRAFLKLETYGRVSGRYCKIDLDKGEFSLTERVSTFKKRLVERGKILGFSLGLLSLISTIWYLVIINVESEVMVYLAVSLWFVYFMLLMWGGNFLLTTLSRAKQLSGKP